jgi:hypothetical protein
MEKKIEINDIVKDNREKRSHKKFGRPKSEEEDKGEIENIVKDMGENYKENSPNDTSSPILYDYVDEKDESFQFLMKKIMDEEDELYEANYKYSTYKDLTEEEIDKYYRSDENEVLLNPRK